MMPSNKISPADVYIPLSLASNGVKASASSFHTGATVYHPSNVMAGNPGFWNPVDFDTELHSWIQLDLGGARQISRVVITSANANRNFEAVQVRRWDILSFPCDER